MTKSNFFINEEGIPIAVDIIEEPTGRQAVLVRSLEGYPFVLSRISHEAGVSIKHPKDPGLRCHNAKWVNRSDILRQVHP